MQTVCVCAVVQELQQIEHCALEALLFSSRQGCHHELTQEAKDEILITSMHFITLNNLWFYNNCDALV